MGAGWWPRRLLELSSAVPVVAGRGHWKAVDISSVPGLPRCVCSLPVPFLRSCLTPCSRNVVKELGIIYFPFLRSLMSECDDIHRWFGVFEGVVSVTNGMLCRFGT